MLNQFTGIGRIERISSNWDMNNDTYYTLLEIALCTDKDNLEFNGTKISMYCNDNLKNLDKVEKDNIIGFNAHYDSNKFLYVMILDKINII